MKTIDYKLMGERIRRQRELLGYTREQLAEKLEVFSKFCSDIELGVKGMSLSTLAGMSDMTTYFLVSKRKNLTLIRLPLIINFFTSL